MQEYGRKEADQSIRCVSESKCLNQELLFYIKAYFNLHPVC